MKNYLTSLLLTGCLLIGLTRIATAQQGGQRKPATPEQRAERRADLLKDKLMLTEEQRNQVYAATLRLEQQRSTDQKEMRQSREAYDNQLQSIFSPEQMEKYEAMREQRKDDIKAKMEQRRTNNKLKSEGEATSEPSTPEDKKN